MATHVKFTSIEHFHSEMSELECFGGEECKYGYIYCSRAWSKGKTEGAYN